MASGPRTRPRSTAIRTRPHCTTRVQEQQQQEHNSTYQQHTDVHASQPPCIGKSRPLSSPTTLVEPVPNQENFMKVWRTERVESCVFQGMKKIRDFDLICRPSEGAAAPRDSRIQRSDVPPRVGAPLGVGSSAATTRSYAPLWLTDPGKR